MEKFQKQLDEAKHNRQSRKQKTEKKRKEVKDKKFKDAMAKADELEKEGKFREAWIKVPDITEFPKSRRDTQTQNSIIRQIRNTEPFRSNGRNKTRTTNGSKKLLPIILLMKQTKMKRIVIIKTEHYVISNAIRKSFILKDKGQDIRLTDPEPRWSVEAVMNFTPICTPILTTAKHLHRR